MAETGEGVHIGPDFPDEYKEAEDALKTKGNFAKAKANAIQGSLKQAYRQKKLTDKQLLDVKKRINSCFELLHRKKKYYKKYKASTLAK